MTEPVPVPALRANTVNTYEEVSLERSHNGRVAVITWDPPKPMNPLSAKLSDEIVTAVEEAQADERLNIVVFRGAGGYFSVGDDLTEMAGSQPGDAPHSLLSTACEYHRGLR